MREELLAEILKLSPGERMQIAEEVWDSLAADYPPATESEIEELERRAARLNAQPDSGVSWKQIKEDLLAKK